MSGLLDSVGDFAKGVGEGAWDGAKGMVEGVGSLAKGGYDLATSADARQQAWDTAVRDANAVGQFAETAVSDPGKAASQVGDAVSSTWGKVSTAYQQAAADGHGAEFIGKAFGQGAVMVGTALIPGGAEAEAVGLLGDAGRAAEVVCDLGKTIDAAGDASKAVKVAGSSSKSAELGQIAEGGNVTDAGHAAAALESPVLRLWGTAYEIPGWHSEPVSYTKRMPDDLASLRREFDGGIRRDFLKDLGANHTGILRAAGMDDAQIERVISGRLPQGY